MSEQVKTAMERLAQNYSCAQSVFSAYAPRFGLDPDAAARTAVCFGAGMSRMSRECGAVTGALMVLGLAFGAAGPDQAAKNLAYDKAREYVRRFTARRGTVMCRELVGCDLSDDAQLAAARESGTFIKVCVPLVQEACELLETMLPTAPEK